MKDNQEYMRKTGKEGEQIARKFFKEKINVSKILQADWIVKKDDNWYLVEVKHQERFEKGFNFDLEGHGLPPYQVKDRLEFQKDTGVRCLFLVIEKPNKDIYWQWFDLLEQGKYIETSKNSRRIYDINSFNKISCDSI